jgi:asparagine synthase (glutamine-hydrolysing)
MCGIVGIIGHIKDEDINWLNKAAFNLKHRGPDAGCSWIAPARNAIFAHRRLSIIDTGHGSDQPFVSDDGKLVLVFNGEIYNYLELRDKLISLGESFRTQGDTEVLLASYRLWGVKCLDHLNGMFAFAIWDQRHGVGRERLFVARDRSGEKPFYYRHEAGRFEFASELKGLRTKGGIDTQGLNHYLALGYVPGDLCLAEGVKKLPPAYAGIMNVDDGQFHTWQYWSLPKLEVTVDEEVNGDDLAEEAWSLLLDSTRLRLRSDVPTGVFLSGGLDSSLVTAAATQVCDTPVQTFTIGVPGSTMDETVYAQHISDAFSTSHHVLQIERPSLDLLDDLAPFIDEPIADSSILPSFMISRLTRQHVTVALGGDGGDELFGGYQHYQNILRDTKLLNWIPGFAFRGMSGLAARLPAGISGRNRVASLRNGPAQSGIWGTPFFDIDLRRKVLSPDVIDLLGEGLAAPEYRSVASLQNSSDLIDGLTRMDFQQLLPDDYLMKVDRASMANSLEVRTPFLDHRLVEFAFSRIPSEWKCNLNERRRVQNLMAIKYLPKEFELNRKQGFSVPMDAWIRDAPMDQLIEEIPRDIFNVNFIKDLVVGQRRGRTNGARLFALMMLNLSSIY